MSRRSDTRRKAHFILPIHANLRGEVRWQTLDERGVPEIPRNPGGFAVGPIEGVTQPNLITNLGLNNIATQEIRYANHNFLATGILPWRRWLAVGTGSVTPAFTNTKLANEAQRELNNSGPFSDGTWWSELRGDPDPEVLRMSASMNRVCVMTAARNLTEFALGHSTNTTDPDPEEHFLEANIRELFRDEHGTPITISLIGGKTIAVLHTLQVDLPMPIDGTPGVVNIEEYDAADNLAATTPYDIVYGLITHDGSHAGSRANTFDHWQPCRQTTRPMNFHRSIGLSAIAVPLTFSRTGMFTSGTQLLPASTTPTAADVGGSDYLCERAPYNPGTYTRVKTVGLGPNIAVGDWYGWLQRGLVEGAQNNGYSGFAVVFTNPATFPVPSSDEIFVSTVSTWGRA